MPQQCKERQKYHLTLSAQRNGSVFECTFSTPPSSLADFSAPTIKLQPIQGAVGKQPITKEDMMQVFRKASRLGTEETKFYLESSGWDLSKALAEWRAEMRWEAEQVRRRGWKCGRLPW